MAITDPILLSPDVILVPVAELPEDVRRRLDPNDGDWAITHPRARTPSRLLDAASAALLAELKTPRTIVDAVIRYSQARDLDPESTLVEAYPLLERLLAAGFLVAEGSDEAGGIAPALKPGDRVAGFEVLECVQALEDTELHLVRGQIGGQSGAAALKIERPAARGKNQEAFAREAAVLERLGGLSGKIAPRLLVTGDLDGRHWLAVEWLPGVDASTAAAELRRRGDRAGLLALCRAVLAAYARLHERGVIHADIHPRNVLVGPAGEIHLIDFGLSLAEGLPGDPGRAGVAFYFEPEYAAAVRAGEEPPAASPAGEQHALAALLFQLIAGAPTHDFKLARDEMLRQIVEEPPLPFALREADPWPDVEPVLARALAKSPAERFASVADFAASLRAVEPPRYSLRSGPAGSLAAEGALARVLERVGVERPLFRDGLPEPPRASVTYGAAGIACALYRIALAREDAALLSL
ncbi:MAG TPA: protein kinase, partial [Thermoanaerobaculia bacterium]